MLTPNLVRGRIRGDTLTLTRISGANRTRAEELARMLLDATQSVLGETREAWEEALASVECRASERVLRDGLIKLIEDRIEFDSAPSIDPVDLRRELFELAACMRNQLPPGARFRREDALLAVARERSVAPEKVEAFLFGDLRSAQTLRKFEGESPESLMSRYDAAQIQAVLLRAVRIRAIVMCSSPAQYRQLFNRLKFRRLLFRLTRRSKGYLVEVDGPFSLFDSVTKYGLQLALAWNALLDCDQVELEADVQWGKGRRPALFQTSHRLRDRSGGATVRSEETLSADAQELLDAARSRGEVWDARPSDVLLDVPGEGVCAPDLTFRHRATQWEAHVELMGYWSRDAVWQRVEWSRAGLGAPVLFVVSERLRVSEDVLDGEDEAALCVFKRKPSVARILGKLEAMRSIALGR